MFKRAAETGGGFPFAIAAVVLVSLALLPFRALVAPPTFMLVSVLVIVTVARFCGVRASGVAAILSFVALDYLYVPPYYRLVIHGASDLLALFVFLVVALLAGQQTALLRRREKSALRRQVQLELLYRLAARISSETSREAVAGFVVGQVLDVLGASRVALYVPGDGAHAPICVATAGDAMPTAAEAAAVASVMRSGDVTPLLEHAEGVEEIEGIVEPLASTERVEGALVAVGSEAAWGADGERFLAAVANLAAASVERLRLTREAARAEAIAEADGLKSTLVSSVSHELKTPLAAATMRVTGLLEEDAPVDAERVRVELAEVAGELARLDASIGDLLDVSRLESDSWRPRFEPEDVYEIVGLAYARVPAFQQSRVVLDLAEGLPLVSADLAQIVRALGNLVGNALAYSPSEETVTITAHRHGNAVEIAVEDRGPGVDDSEKDRVFEKFYRGSGSAMAPGGTGLGLAITHEIVRSHDGYVRVEDGRERGARFVMVLPAIEET